MKNIIKYPKCIVFIVFLVFTNCSQLSEKGNYLFEDTEAYINWPDDLSHFSNGIDSVIKNVDSDKYKAYNYSKSDSGYYNFILFSFSIYSLIHTFHTRLTTDYLFVHCVDSSRHPKTQELLVHNEFVIYRATNYSEPEWLGIMSGNEIYELIANNIIEEKPCSYRIGEFNRLDDFWITISMDDFRKKYSEYIDPAGRPSDNPVDSLNFNCLRNSLIQGIFYASWDRERKNIKQRFN